LDELREALAIEVGQQHSRPERLYTDIHKVALWCENLVRVDEEFQLVQFAHRAVLQFLLEASPNSQFYFVLDDVDHEIGEMCITYLNFNDFKTTLARRQQLPRVNPIQPLELAQTALTYEPKMSAIGRILKTAS
jgi:hypothetical protein